jgi:hypothetical protein
MMSFFLSFSLFLLALKASTKPEFATYSYQEEQSKEGFLGMREEIIVSVL